MARSPIPDLIERFHNLTPEERKCFLDLVDPQPEPEPAKQTRKKRTTKSTRASSMAAAIKKSLEQGKDAAENAPHSNGQLCKALVPGLGVECAEPEENAIHDQSAGYAAYHPFSLTAPTVERKSRRKGAAANITPSTETNSEGALAAGAGGD